MIALGAAVLAALVVIAIGLPKLKNPAVARAGQQIGYVPPKQQPVALMWGDSYFNGANGVTAEQTYAYLAATKLGYLASVNGYGGTGFVASNPTDHTPDYEAQLKAGAVNSIVAPDVRLIVIEGGLNDLSAPPAEVKANAATVFADFKHRFPKARIVTLGPVAPTGTPTPAERAIVRAIRSAANAASLPFIDALHWVTPANVGQIIGSDHEHPTAAGHRILAGDLVAALRRLER